MKTGMKKERKKDREGYDMTVKVYVQGAARRREQTEEKRELCSKAHLRRSSKPPLRHQLQLQLRLLRRIEQLGDMAMTDPSIVAKESSGVNDRRGIVPLEEHRGVDSRWDDWRTWRLKANQDNPASGIGCFLYP
jgi:hypothetical protein